MQSMNNLKKGKNEQDFKPKKIYLDTNAFIYSAIDETTIGEKSTELISKIKEGKYKAYTATLTIDEFLWRVKKEVGKEKAIKAVEIFQTLANLTLISVDMEVITKAIEIFKTTSLDPRDAIHLAAMKQKNITTIYSTDSDFDKIEDIKRINLE